MHKRFIIALAVVLALTMAACSNPPNREEIIDITNAYLAALVAHDPAAAPLAENIAFVENIQKMSPGEGLWESAVSGPTSFAIYVPDVENQTAGFMGMMTYMAPPPPPPPSESAEEGEASEETAEAVEPPESSEPPEEIEQPVLLAQGAVPGGQGP